MLSFFVAAVGNLRFSLAPNHPTYPNHPRARYRLHSTHTHRHLLTDARHSLASWHARYFSFIVRVHGAPTPACSQRIFVRGLRDTDTTDDATRSLPRRLAPAGADLCTSVRSEYASDP